MLIIEPVLEEDEFLEDDNDNPSQVTQLNDQLTQQNQQTQTTQNSGSWYSGSAFAGMLVVVLFVVWALYKMGCLGHD